MPHSVMGSTTRSCPLRIALVLQRTDVGCDLSASAFMAWRIQRLTACAICTVLLAFLVALHCASRSLVGEHTQLRPRGSLARAAHTAPAPPPHDRTADEGHPLLPYPAPIGLAGAPALAPGARVAAFETLSASPETPSAAQGPLATGAPAPAVGVPSAVLASGATPQVLASFPLSTKNGANLAHWDHPGRSTLTSASLAGLAMQWLAAHPDVLAQDDYPSTHHYRVIVDYCAHPHANYSLAFMQPPDWAFVTAYLPAADPFALRRAGLVADNQIVWAPPQELNLKTLWASMNLFDSQLLLRVEDVLAAIPGLSLQELIGNTLPLARKSYLILPCSITNQTGAIHEAVQWARDQKYVLGVRHLEVHANPCCCWEWL